MITTLNQRNDRSEAAPTLVSIIFVIAQYLLYHLKLKPSKNLIGRGCAISNPFAISIVYKELIENQKGSLIRLFESRGKDINTLSQRPTPWST